ncbi:ABCB1 [Bugula neritina]|uniref:ABCB1 n=1 Tax=Bugula neritina TaxID=10212 RepID=A0A7J7K8I5_BUGNE|nr:ABCB1 [Bugula neritina]
MGWNSSEWYLICIGCLGCLIEGGGQPAFAVVFTKIISAFLSCDSAVVRARANFYSLMFVVIAFVMFFAISVDRLMFAIAGERLTERLRKKAFRAYLRQDVHYFDDPKNNTGALTTRLATEAAAVQGSTGPALGAVLNAIANMGVGIGIALYFSWILTLAILGFAPFIGLSGFIQTRMSAGGITKKKMLFEASGKIASESISSIRTVQSLGKEQLFYEKYKELSEEPYKKELKFTYVIGATFSFSKGIIFIAYAVLFYLGAWLITTKTPNNPQPITFEDMMITFSAVVFGAMSLAQITNYSPNYKKGVIAAGYIKRLLDSQPEIDAYSEEGEKLVSLSVCVSVRPSLPVRLCLCVCLCVYVSLCVGLCLCVCLSLYACLSVCVSIYSQLTIFSNK